MTRQEQNDEAFRRAVAVGCEPIWYDGIMGRAWHCGCESLAHACDQQCSVVDFYFQIAKEKAHPEG